MKVDKNFMPCAVDIGDELYPNGIFEFNITKILNYIKNYPNVVVLDEVTVSDFPKGFSSINDSHLPSVEISTPVILAEISPGRFNLIDGHHRMEKARRVGVKRILAYKLKVDQHTQFLTSKKAYEAYVEYWNNKLKDSR